MMMTQNKMVSSVTDHHEMAPKAHGECSAVNLRCRITLWSFLDMYLCSFKDYLGFAVELRYSTHH